MSVENYHNILLLRERFIKTKDFFFLMSDKYTCLDNFVEHVVRPTYMPLGSRLKKQYPKMGEDIYLLLSNIEKTQGKAVGLIEEGITASMYLIPSFKSGNFDLTGGIVAGFFAMDGLSRFYNSNGLIANVVKLLGYEKQPEILKE